MEGKEGKESLTVCLIASFSLLSLVRRDSGGVRMLAGVDDVLLEKYCVGGAGWLYGGGGPAGYWCAGLAAGGGGNTCGAPVRRS
jgi:hypothetical protein